MMSESHSDGGCFKLTVEYTDYLEADPFEPYIRWGDNFDECLEDGLKRKKYIEENGRYIIDFRIQDDSK